MRRRSWKIPQNARRLWRVEVLKGELRDGIDEWDWRVGRKGLGIDQRQGQGARPSRHRMVWMLQLKVSQRGYVAGSKQHGPG